MKEYFTLSVFSGITLSVLAMVCVGLFNEPRFRFFGADDELPVLAKQYLAPAVLSLYAASKEVVRKYKPFLDEIDLTYTQYIAMMVLWGHKSVTVKDLGSFLYLDSGTLTSLLKKLEAKGFLSRKREEQDERNLIVSITPEGEALRKRAVSIPQEMAGSFITHFVNH